MCKYCEPESEESISEMDVDCGALGGLSVYTYIDHSRALATEFYNSNKPVKKSVEINYCPMCGRELVEQELSYADVCYECTGYGDDWYTDPETGEQVRACDDCVYNREDEEE